MHIAKWGNSLAVRLPVAVVKALGLKEGDEVTLTAAGEGKLEVAREVSDQAKRDAAVERIRAMRIPFPPDFKFNRNDIYDR
jgi:antitoxin MazE